MPTLDGPTPTELRARLPARLQQPATTGGGGVSSTGSNAALEAERASWLTEVGALLSIQYARERCEVLGLLILLRYMPLHHTSDPESLDPLSDLLTSQTNSAAAAAAAAAAADDGAPLRRSLRHARRRGEREPHPAP